MPQFTPRASSSYQHRLYLKGPRGILIPFKLLFRELNLLEMGFDVTLSTDSLQTFSQKWALYKSLAMRVFFLFSSLRVNQLGGIKYEFQRSIDYVCSLFAALFWINGFLFVQLRNVWAAAFSALWRGSAQSCGRVKSVAVHLSCQTNCSDLDVSNRLASPCTVAPRNNEFVAFKKAWLYLNNMWTV